MQQLMTPEFDVANIRITLTLSTACDFSCSYRVYDIVEEEIASKVSSHKS